MLKKLTTFLLLVTLPIISFAKEKGIDEQIDDFVGSTTGWFVSLIFAKIKFTEGIEVYWVLFPLILGAIYFSIYYKFINFRGFFTSINIVRGKYDHVDKHGAYEAAGDVTDGDIKETIKVEEEGEVSHFQALTAALSATVGLGNIAGVAIALSIGGAGATFWMIIAGLLGMASKFVECTLGVKYRDIDQNGVVFGGPMYYLKKGLASLKMKKLGQILAILFAIMCIGGSFGGGNMFQVNQAYQLVENMSSTKVDKIDNSIIGKNFYLGKSRLTVKEFDDNNVFFERYLTVSKSDFIKDNAQFNSIENINKEIINQSLTYKGNDYNVNDVSEESLIFDNHISVTKDDFLTNAKSIPLDGKGWLFGLIMAILVGIVIIGGIKKIAKVTDKIVPIMVLVYVLASIFILISKSSLIGEAFSRIISEAFYPTSIAGGAIGVLVQGFKRAAFSNEAGIGSASIAHSAVKTNHAASEGMVALLEPFIDTVIVCTMTALVLIVTGSVSAENSQMNDAQAILLTSEAFGSVISWFPYILTIAVVLFAFSSMISWSYYGFQAWSFLFGRSKSTEYTYKVIFCCFTVLGAAASLGNVINFSDAMIFAMMVPNMIGLIILAPKVKDELKKYMGVIKKS